MVAESKYKQVQHERPLIGLLTDFGLSDAYVGQLKASILAQAPQTNIIDISHNVPPFNIRVAAYYITASAKYFPPHSLFLCIVDPEVGSKREIIALQTNSQTFIAPNNGLLSLIKKTSDAKLWRLSCLSQRQSSYLFAGRDLMSPIAGKLINGEPISSLAEPANMESLIIPHWGQPILSNKTINADILHIDHFGNVITNLTHEQWNLINHPKNLRLLINGREQQLSYAEYYAQIPKNSLAILVGSQGYMEIAMCQSPASALLGLKHELKDYPPLKILL